MRSNTEVEVRSRGFSGFLEVAVFCMMVVVGVDIIIGGINVAFRETSGVCFGRIDVCIFVRKVG